MKCIIINMFYKGILLDLDNTLYSYDRCHEKGLEKALNFLHGINNSLDHADVNTQYVRISNAVKYEMNTASFLLPLSSYIDY